MSRLSLSLFISAIFAAMLTQMIARQEPLAMTASTPKILLVCGLLYCTMKILFSWIDAPPPHNVEDENNDPQD